jgi:hypothetical protein
MDIATVLDWFKINKDALAGISSLLSGIGAILAVAAFIFAVVQYRRSEHWKRAEYLADLFESFEKDEACKTAMQLLDWHGREVTFEENGKQITECAFEDDIFRALIPATDSEDRTGFTPLEVRIRDCFDRFLGYIEDIERAIQQGLVDQNDVYVYFHYWAGMLHGERPHLRDDIRLRLLDYAKYFDFENVQQFLDRWPSKVKHAP